MSENIYECPICRPILEDIASARTLMDVLEIRSHDIRRARGITLEQRGDLQMVCLAREKEIMSPQSAIGNRQSAILNKSP